MKTLKTIRVTKAILLIGLLGISTTSIAKHHGDGEQRGKRGAPPEAIEACNSLSLGDACEFNGRRGNVSGTCITPPEKEDVLACKPERHRRSGGDDDTQG